MNAKGFFGEDFPYVFRPLHKAQASGIDVVVKSDVEGFGSFFDAVEIEMEDAFTGGCAVFVDYREGGRRDGIFPYAQNATKCRYEGGLAGPHGSIKCHEGTVTDFREELLGSCVDSGKVFYG